MKIKEKVLKEDEWLRFIEKGKKEKTIVVSVFSKCSKVELGLIKWHPSWRHYCFFPYLDIEAVYSDRCDFAIYDFTKELNVKHKTLAEVGKVIDEKLKSLIHKKIDKSNNYFQRDGSNVPIRDYPTYDFLKELKEELGIK